MRIAHLIAGAGGMYCGACLRENRLAATHIHQGRDVVLVPLYTPIRTDEVDVTSGRVYYGGLNVYLQQKWPLLRRTPRVISRIFDSHTLLRLITRWGMKTKAEDLGALTVSVMSGAHGAQARELDKLIDALGAINPSLINLPNLMFVGMAKSLKQALGVPVLCTLAGEDAFLDALPEPHRENAFDLIRKEAVHFDGFIAPTKYYAKRASDFFGLPAERIHYIPMGIRADEFTSSQRRNKDDLSIGYLAAVCPEKGLAELCDAFSLLRDQGRTCRLRIAGYVGAAGRKYWNRIERKLESKNHRDAVDFIGEVDSEQKRGFLQSIDLFCVPTSHPEPKGFYVLEAMASGLPVVQPRHGSFPELIERTNGGLLYDPTGPDALASALAECMDSESLRVNCSQNGMEGVRNHFTDTHMADATWTLYERFCNAPSL